MLGIALTLVGCATDVQRNPTTGATYLQIQNKGLHPGNGGVLIASAVLRPGDIILSSANSITSVGIRLAGFSPVSHAALYMGNDQIAEAVGSGIRQRSTADFLDEEATVVAFRNPALTTAHATKIGAFVQSHLGQKYNYLGVVLQAPFTLERRLCELPLVPGLLRDFCVRGVAAIQLGLGSNDRFFCSQFVLEAYRQAGLALTDADSRLVSPDDLLHMREGDVSSVRIHQPLLYLGHLKTLPEEEAVTLSMAATH